MKKLFLTLMALVATMSIDAQMVKIMKGDQLLAKYLVPNGGKVVFEKAPPITGSVYAKEPNCEIGWVQLWLDGPKFAVCNIGAENNKPEDYGGYYTWGGTYKNGAGITWKDDHNDGESNLSCTGDNITDTATKLWGDKWRMPTKEEFDALINNKNCTCQLTTQNGVNGLLCKGKEGTAFESNSVFFPAAGSDYNGHVDRQAIEGDYWSASPSNSYSHYLYFNFKLGTLEEASYDRRLGYSVRAVLNEAYVTNGNER